MLAGARGKATLCAVVPADHAARGLQAESLIERFYVCVAHQVDHIDAIELVEKLADQLRPDTLATTKWVLPASSRWCVSGDGVVGQVEKKPRRSSGVTRGSVGGSAPRLPGPR